MLEHNRQLQTLTGFKKDGNLPSGLIPQVTSHIKLSDTLKERWDTSLKSCSNKLLKILMSHHTNEIKLLEVSRGDLRSIFTPEELHGLDVYTITSFENQKRGQKRKPLENQKDTPVSTKPPKPSNTRHYNKKNSKSKNTKLIS